MTESICFLAEDKLLEQALQDVLGHVPAQSRNRFALERTSGRRRAQHELSRLWVVSWAKDLASVDLRTHEKCVEHRWEGYLIFVGQDTPAESLSAVTRLRVQDPSRLQFVTAADLGQARSHLESFVKRLHHSGDSEGILHAWWSGDSLEVLTTGFRRLKLPRASLAPLGDSTLEECQDLEVSYDGSYIAWPSADAHLGFEQIEALVSPARVLRRRQENDEFNRRYGEAIRSVREMHKLTQSSIPGLSARQVGRIERGETRATSKALGKLAKAHGLAESDYLEEIAVALDLAS